MASRGPEFVVSDFDDAIDEKGYDFEWSRATLCPCETNTDTKQPDPTCSVCRGDGIIFFNPDDPLSNTKFVQIKGITTNMTKDPQVYFRSGQFIMGLSMVTVKPINHISWGDRLVSVDSVVPHYQIVDGTGDTLIKHGTKGDEFLKFPVNSVNLLRTTDTIFTEIEDFTVTEDGDILWNITPPNEPISVHYLYHPIWIVQSHIHTYRDTFVKFKNPSPKFTTMPIQAMIKLKFIGESDEESDE